MVAGSSPLDFGYGATHDIAQVCGPCVLHTFDLTTYHCSSSKYFRIPKHFSNSLDEKIFRPRFAYSKLRPCFRIKTKEKFRKWVKTRFHRSVDGKTFHPDG